MATPIDADSWQAGRAAGWDAGWKAGWEAGWDEGSKAQLQRINQLVEEKELLQQELDKLKSVTQSSPQTCVKRARKDNQITPRPLLCSLLLPPCAGATATPPDADRHDYRRQRYRGT